MQNLNFHTKFFLLLLKKSIYTKILNLFLFSLLLILIVFNIGCTNSSIGSYSGIEDIEENTISRIGDIPFPKGSRLIIKDSLIMGEGKNWSGQLAIKVPEDKIKVFNFYIRNLKEYGWKEQTTIRGEISVLNYLGPNKRVAIITIAKRGLISSDVIVSVSPFTRDFDEALGDEITETFLSIDE